MSDFTKEIQLCPFIAPSKGLEHITVLLWKREIREMSENKMLVVNTTLPLKFAYLFKSEPLLLVYISTENVHQTAN